MGAGVTPDRDPIDALDHGPLARLVPELLLVGQLVDRAGMPALLQRFGLDGMRDVAIEEWQAASPHYTARMKAALGIRGDGVAEIFKGFQLDVGAPPEFMDFRYRVDDHDHGAFWLDHCGALMDVEPMGDELVRTMCHDIEDPTFPATALATNPRARVEPVHRPPRVPPGRTPHCEWVVTIDPDAEPAAEFPATTEAAPSRAVGIELGDPAPRPAGEPGTLAHYDGPLLSDLRFADFTGAALVRILREVELQIHLLAIGFTQSVRRRSDDETALRLAGAQATGIAGVAAERLAAVVAPEPGEPDGPLDRLARVLDVHPLCAPVAYTGATVRRIGDGLEVAWDRGAPWFDDDSWGRVLAAGDLRPLAAAARAVDPHLVVGDGAADDRGLVAIVRRGDEARPEAEEVALTRLSTGAGFAFGPPRPALPLTPV